MFGFESLLADVFTPPPLIKPKPRSSQPIQEATPEPRTQQTVTQGISLTKPQTQVSPSKQTETTKPTAAKPTGRAGLKPFTSLEGLKQRVSKLKPSGITRFLSKHKLKVKNLSRDEQLEFVKHVESITKEVEVILQK